MVIETVRKQRLTLIVVIEEIAAIHSPKQGHEEKKYHVAQFEKALLLFPIEQVEYLGHIYKVLSSHIPDSKRVARFVI